MLSDTEVVTLINSEINNALGYDDDQPRKIERKLTNTSTVRTDPMMWWAIVKCKAWMLPTW